MRKKKFGYVFNIIAGIVLISLLLKISKIIFILLLFVAFICITFILTNWYFKVHYISKTESRKCDEESYEPRPKMNSYQIERYAIECNAHLEHKEEMDDYKKYFNIDEK